MAIRTRKYRNKVTGNVVKVVRITEKNLTELVEYINRKGGAATGHNGDTRSKRPARIRIKQRNYGENWGKRDWRVAQIGDAIIQHEFPNGEHHREVGAIEFARVKEDTFEDAFELVK